MKLFGSTKSKITKDKNGENVPHLEITEVVLLHCNIVNNDYEQDSRVLYTLVPNKSICQLLDMSPKKSIFLKIFDSNFHILKYDLPLEIKGKRQNDRRENKHYFSY